ncbi:hypothetical protein [Neptuniibacter sp. QD37_11]|uniref:hypothetical protein n=1 Tax=Neptuniibacter sp. QD37_11 TaxID=3398209 RepID=UPI0039F57867
MQATTDVRFLLSLLHEGRTFVSRIFPNWLAYSVITLVVVGIVFYFKQVDDVASLALGGYLCLGISTAYLALPSLNRTWFCPKALFSALIAAGMITASLYAARLDIHDAIIGLSSVAILFALNNLFNNEFPSFSLQAVIVFSLALGSLLFENSSFDLFLIQATALILVGVYLLPSDNFSAYDKLFIFSSYLIFEEQILEGHKIDIYIGTLCSILLFVYPLTKVFFSNFLIKRNLTHDETAITAGLTAAFVMNINVICADNIMALLEFSLLLAAPFYLYAITYFSNYHSERQWIVSANIAFFIIAPVIPAAMGIEKEHWGMIFEGVLLLYLGCRLQESLLRIEAAILVSLSAIYSALIVAHNMDWTHNFNLSDFYHSLYQWALTILLLCTALLINLSYRRKIQVDHFFTTLYKELLLTIFFGFFLLSLALWAMLPTNSPEVLNVLFHTTVLITPTFLYLGYKYNSPSLKMISALFQAAGVWLMLKSGIGAMTALPLYLVQVAAVTLSPKRSREARVVHAGLIFIIMLFGIASLVESIDWTAFF